MSQPPNPLAEIVAPLARRSKSTVPPITDMPNWRSTSAASGHAATPTRPSNNPVRRQVQAPALVVSVRERKRIIAAPNGTITAHSGRPKDVALKDTLPPRPWTASRTPRNGPASNRVAPSIMPAIPATAPRLPAPVLNHTPAAQPTAQYMDTPKSRPPTMAPPGKYEGKVGCAQPSANTAGTATICTAMASNSALTLVKSRLVTTNRKPELRQNAPRWAM